MSSRPAHAWNPAHTAGVRRFEMGEREDRFTRLFAHAYGPLWAYARRRVPADDVDDVVAEVFTVAWRRLEDVPDGERSLPWLYGVAFKIIGNARRARSRRNRLLTRLKDQPQPSPPDDPDRAVSDALDRLRPEDQEILRLAAWEDFQPREIAVVLGCSANAATLRLSRARARLREHLTGSDGRRTQAGRKEIDV